MDNSLRLDLWADGIFKKLPIKTLGRIRSVCKEWNSLISSGFCIAAQHSSISGLLSPDRKPFLLLAGGSCTLYDHHSDQPLPDLSFPFRFQDIVYPSRFINYELVDVINGVLCVYHSLSSSFDSSILWNPAIRRFIPLPPPPETEEEEDNKALEVRMFGILKTCAIGFGYQKSKNDFKVVRVWIRIPSSLSSSSCLGFRYEVFSSQQGYWREVAEANLKPFKGGFKSCRFLKPSTGCFLNGTIHWLVSTSNGDVFDQDKPCSLLVLMFDCERETFRTMELPEELSLFQVSPRGSKRLLKYSGCMLSVTLSSGVNGGRCELWVMKDGGWNKLFSQHGDALKLDPPHLLNAHVFEESMFLMDHIKGAKNYSKDEEIDIQLHPRTSGSGSSRWRCPPVNWIKLNTHGVSIGKEHYSGLGGVFRDHRGRFVQAFSYKTRRESAFEAQLIAMWHGLDLAMSMGIKSLIVETDSIEVVQGVTTSNFETKPTNCYTLVLPCEWFLRHCPWRVGVCHAPAEFNKVAHWFARASMRQDEYHVVLRDVPDGVEQLLANDIGETTYVI